MRWTSTACPAAKTITLCWWIDEPAGYAAAFCGTRRNHPAGTGKLPTPCYLLDEDALTRNAEILGGLAQRTGCKVLLAKGVQQL